MPTLAAALKKIGFAANRRLLGVQRLSHDCTLGRSAAVRSTGRASPDTALEVIRRAETGHTGTLVLCPARLESMWRGFAGIRGEFTTLDDPLTFSVVTRERNPAPSGPSLGTAEFSQAR